MKMKERRDLTPVCISGNEEDNMQPEGEEHGASIWIGLAYVQQKQCLAGTLWDTIDGRWDACIGMHQGLILLH